MYCSIIVGARIIIRMSIIILISTGRIINNSHTLIRSLSIGVSISVGMRTSILDFISSSRNLIVGLNAMIDRRDTRNRHRYLNSVRNINKDR